MIFCTPWRSYLVLWLSGAASSETCRICNAGSYWSGSGKHNSSLQPETSYSLSRYVCCIPLNKVSQVPVRALPAHLGPIQRFQAATSFPPLPFSGLFLLRSDYSPAILVTCLTHRTFFRCRSFECKRVQALSGRILFQYKRCVRRPLCPTPRPRLRCTL